MAREVTTALDQVQRQQRALPMSRQGQDRESKRRNLLCGSALSGFVSIVSLAHAGYYHHMSTESCAKYIVLSLKLMTLVCNEY